MATTKETVGDLQAQYLDAVRKSQTAVLDGLRAWTQSVQQLVPSQRAAWPQGEELPGPSELVDSVFDFAAQLLNAQREFAQGVLGATASIGERARQQAETATQQAQKTTRTS